MSRFSLSHALRPHSLRIKLIGSLIAVSFFIGLLSLIVGGNLLYQSVLNEVNMRIRQDLNVAKGIYNERKESVKGALQMVAALPEIQSTVASGHTSQAVELIRPLLADYHIDILGILDTRSTVPASDMASSLKDILPLVKKALNTHQSIAGTFVMTPDELMTTDPELVSRISFPNLGHTSHPASHTSSLQQNTTIPGPAVLSIGAAIPIISEQHMVGILYGASLLNNDTTMVDTIGHTVFQNEIYKGRNVGTATIFYKNIRIATNVKEASGKRALGTIASPAVTEQVLGQGRNWTDRAKVLGDWYITAYAPIVDIFEQRIGMLYVGVLEAKYRDVKEKAFIVFSTITLSGVLIAILLGWLATARIMRPVSQLIKASDEISKGNFSPNMGEISPGDIGLLQQNFLIMAQALQEREKRQQAESQFQLLQSAKQASIGKLAAGVAHEINNPLTAVLTFTHLILRREDLPANVRSDLEMVASQTERVRQIVKSLLDFSRQSALHPEPTNIKALIEESVQLMRNQALIKGIELKFDANASFPDFMIDRNQLQSVLINMILNALDATAAGGKVSISLQPSSISFAGDGGAEISIADTGTGIDPEYIERLFDPFFTTKTVGKGTGLGLAVSAGIVERHGGTIKVTSKLGSGSCFTIDLPHVPPEHPRKNTTTATRSNDEDSCH